MWGMTVRVLWSGVKEDVVMRIEKGMLRWFVHVKTMEEWRLMKQVHNLSFWVLDRIIVRGRPQWTHSGHIGSHVKSIYLIQMSWDVC